MIDPKELRIGNLVICKRYRIGEEYITDVENVGYWGVNGDANHDIEIDGKEAWPISLSEEWLEKFGLKKCWLDLPDESSIYHRGDTLSIMPKDGISGGHQIECPCKYVHQLQNLYFALTGEELTIKQP
jgi:hypothetical protein